MDRIDVNDGHENSHAAQEALTETTIRRLGGLDLNLLVVFAALMQERSVTLAAQRLFVGQPAVSASLKRLRALFKDPLFVKAGRGMAATDRAMALQPVVERVLAQIDALAFSATAFDPAQSRGTFRLGLSDDNEIVFLPAITRELQRQAPHARLVASAISHTDVRAGLDQGRVDVGLSVFGELDNWHRSEVLFEQGYGCLFDPAVRHSTAPLELDEFLASRQTIVTFDGVLGGKIDRVLAGRGLQRNVCLGTARFATLPHLVQGTDLVACLPELVGRVLARTHGLAFCPLPLVVPPGLPRLAWHRRHDVDPVHQWLRTLITGCVMRVVAEIRGSGASA